MSTLHHIGIAVRSLDERLAFYRALGIEAGGREEVLSEKVNVAFLPVEGTRIELLEPTAPESPIARFLDKRGEGLHHLCFEVQDIREAMRALETAGCRLLSAEPRPGAHGSEVCFVHPASAGGVLVELRQSGR